MTSVERSIEYVQKKVLLERYRTKEVMSVMIENEARNMGVPPSVARRILFTRYVAELHNFSFPEPETIGPDREDEEQARAYR